jgi:hypothetical protein
MTAIHAGLSATAFILVRETRGWLFPIDPCICLVATLSIIACWGLFRGETAPLRGMMIGALVAVATGVITAGLLALSLTRIPVLSDVGILATIAVLAVWLYTLFIAAVGAVIAGLVSGSLTRWVIQPLGRAGLAIGSATAIFAAIVPLGALVGRSALAMGFLDLVTRYDELRPFPAAVTVELTIGGEPVPLERVFYCRRPTNFLDEYTAKDGGVRSPYWMPSIKSFGHVLAGGGGVFVITPDACRTLAQSPPPAAGSVGNNVLAADYVPLVGWTANAATLDAFDLYVDGTAYARKDARVRVAGIAVRRLPFGAEASPLDAFAKIGWDQHPSNGAEYRAVYGIKMSSAVWRGNSVVASRLAGVRVPAIVLQDYQERARDDSRVAAPASVERDFYGVLIARNGTGIPREPSQGDDHYYHVRGRMPVAGPVIPFRPSDGAWAPSFQEEGVLAFYRTPRNYDTNRVPTPLVIRGHRLTHDQKLVYVFDPASLILTRVDIAQFTLVGPDGPFASRDR